MKKNQLILLGTVFTLLFLYSCKKGEFEIYDHPFFHIHVDNSDRVTVNSNRRDTVDYKVYLSSKLQFEPIDVQYEIEVGDGLEAGRDFELITTGNTLKFSQGIFERPITIAWKQSELDPEKNNTLIIRLINNSKGYTLGLPGPDKNQSWLIINKVNIAN